MITFRQQGDFSRLTRFLERAKEAVKLGDLDKYGQAGVAALAAATPVDSGLTANRGPTRSRTGAASPRSHSTIPTFKMVSPLPSFCNTGMERGPEAGYRDEIHQPCDPAHFDRIANDAWREVTKT